MSRPAQSAATRAALGISETEVAPPAPQPAPAKTPATPSQKTQRGNRIRNGWLNIPDDKVAPDRGRFKPRAK